MIWITNLDIGNLLTVAISKQVNYTVSQSGGDLSSLAAAAGPQLSCPTPLPTFVCWEAGPWERKVIMMPMGLL